jgi:3-isopropylmalate/(R)-2-methylmalate dehydratase small subunit
MKVTGNVWKFPQDDINTDQIRRKTYAHLPAAEQAKHCFEEFDPQFADRVKPGDILVVGRNFGCGSSTLTHGALMALGIAAIVAESFGRLFFRSSLSDGLPVAVCPGVTEAINAGDRIEVDTVEGTVKNLASATTLSCKPLPAVLNEILEYGGEKAYLKARIARETQAR